MIKTVFVFIGTGATIYLLIAVTLSLLPVSRNVGIKSLDFNVLSRKQGIRVPGTETWYKARDGAELFYRLFPGRSRISLILIHGSGSEGRYLTGLAQRLSATGGITVLVPDLRGHGRSVVTRLGDVDYVGQLEDDLGDLNAHLRNTDPEAILILGGHSSGGGLAVKYGGNPGLSTFDGFLLLAPYLGYQSPTVRPDSGGWVQVARRRYAGLAMLNNVGIRLLNSLPVLFFNRPREWQDPRQADSYSYRLNESFAPRDYAEDLANNSQPMLVLVGTDDEAFYVEEFEPVFAGSAPHAKLELISGAKHLNLADNEVTFTVVREWLATVEEMFRDPADNRR